MRTAYADRQREPFRLDTHDGGGHGTRAACAGLRLDAAFVRKRFYRTLMSFARKLMLGGRLPAFKAFRNIEAVEDAYRQSERSLNDEAVLSFMMDRISFP